MLLEWLRGGKKLISNEKGPQFCSSSHWPGGFIAGPCDLWPCKISSISDPLWCVTDKFIGLVQYMLSLARHGGTNRISSLSMLQFTFVIHCASSKPYHWLWPFPSLSPWSQHNHAKVDDGDDTPPVSCDSPLRKSTLSVSMWIEFFCCQAVSSLCVVPWESCLLPSRVKFK